MLQRHALGLGLSLCLFGVAARAEDPAAGYEWVYVGTHGGGGGPPGAAVASTTPAPAPRQGIYAARLDLHSGHLSEVGLVAEVPRATWLIHHPTLPILYSVGLPGNDMHAEAALYSLEADRATGQLKLLGQVGAGGQDATHLDLDVPSMTVFSANHGDGSTTALPIEADGSLGAVVSTQKEYGSGPTPRQKGPAAHAVAIDPTHHFVLTADFGADRIFVYRFDPKTRALTPTLKPFEQLPAGSGPRHLVFHPGGQFLFMDTELSAEIRSYRWDPRHGHLHLVQVLSSYPAQSSGEKSAAELAVSQDGKYLYVSNRGEENSLVVYAINGRRGTLSEIQRIASQGTTPWSFGIDPSGHWLLVTNEGSNAVAEFKVDPSTGKLTATGESMTVPVPVTVAFLP